MSVIHTACRFCGQDIEGLSPYRAGEWRDRGNNTTCLDGLNIGKKHAPLKTTAERMRESRQRRRDQGLVKLELWAAPEHHAEIKSFAANLKGKTIMNTYILNDQGQHYVRAFITEHGKTHLIAEAFFTEAEQSANDNFDRGMSAVLEIGRQYSYDGRPYTLTLLKEWFDAQDQEN